MLSESPIATILFAAYSAALWTILLLLVWWGISTLLKRPARFGLIGLHSLIAAFLLGELAGILTPASQFADHPDAPIYNSLMLGSWLGAFLGAVWGMTNSTTRLKQLGWLGFGRSLLFTLIKPPQIQTTPLNPTPTRLDFSHQSLHHRSFRQQILSGANFQGANLTGVDFRNAKLIGATFAGAIAPQTNFTGADLSGATFAQAQLDQAIFDRIKGFCPTWRYRLAHLRHWRNLLQPWAWLLLVYGLVSLGFFATTTGRARLMLIGLMLVCGLALVSFMVMGLILLTQFGNGSSVAILVLMINAGYLLNSHPAKPDLTSEIEVIGAIAAGMIALLGLVQKRWILCLSGWGLLCGCSAVAIVPILFRDQLPFPLLYSGIFILWGLAIGHGCGQYFERGICSFQSAQLDGATFAQADVRFAQFRDAHLTNTRFSQAQTQGTPVESLSVDSA